MILTFALSSAGITLLTLLYKMAYKSGKQDNRIDYMEKRLMDNAGKSIKSTNSLEENVMKILGKVDSMDNRLQNIEDKIREHDSRLGKIEEKVNRD